METAEPTGESPAPSMPDWARMAFEDFLTHQEDLTRVLQLSKNGIAMLRGRQKAIEALGKVGGMVEDYEKKLALAVRERALAQTEIDNDFPLLHEQATVALWSSLEALVRSFAARWFMKRPGALQCEAVRKLKVRIGDYEALDADERCLWIVDLLDQDAGGPLRVGVSRFESLLHPLGLDGDLGEDLRKTLFELSQVRNVIVHRRAVADRRLIDSCPWLGLKVGDRLRVTHDMWKRYNQAVAEYILELIQRVRVAFGLPRYEHEAVPTAQTKDEEANQAPEPTPGLRPGAAHL